MVPPKTTLPLRSTATTRASLPATLLGVRDQRCVPSTPENFAKMLVSPPPLLASVDPPTLHAPAQTPAKNTSLFPSTATCQPTSCLVVPNLFAQRTAPEAPFSLARKMSSLPTLVSVVAPKLTAFWKRPVTNTSPF